MRTLAALIHRTWRDALFLLALIAAYFVFGFYVLPHLGIST